MATSKSGSRKKKSADVSSGRLPVVFGVLTVVALLVIGWVLVHGGLSDALLPGKKALQVLLSGEAGEKLTSDDIKEITERYEKRIQDLQQTHQDAMAALKDQYEQQLDELRFEIKVLQDENTRLQKPGD
ncbi:MAG: hypothetical protein ABIH23_22635 [bacterium]